MKDYHSSLGRRPCIFSTKKSKRLEYVKSPENWVFSPIFVNFILYFLVAPGQEFWPKVCSRKSKFLDRK